MNDLRENRRIVLLSAALGLLAIRAFAADETADGRLTYRGFVVDITAVRGAANLSTIINSVKHQLDIVADCGAKQEIIDFFRGRRIALVHGLLGGTPGRFIPNHGVDIEAAVLPQQQPIILHELLHAYHYLMLPDSWKNSDVQQFYDRAKEYNLYPATEIHDGRRGPTYLLSDEHEFFAVTASVYLWGFVDREPHNRETLKMLQPIYYQWLGDQFGVKK